MAATWRDITTYQYLSADETAMVLVGLAGPRDPQTAEALLTAAVANYSSIYDSLIVYQKRFAPAPPPGARVAAVEGDQRSEGSGPNRRFAFAAIESGTHRAVITFLIPSRPDFIQLVKHVVASIRMTPFGPDEEPGTGMQRFQANLVRMDLPADWKGPETLGFLDPESDHVSLRVTIAEPPSPEGAINLSAEVAGPIRVISSESAPAQKAVPGSHGWDAKWTVERARGPSSEVVVRKASLTLNPGRGVAVTLYGKAPVALATALAEVWELVRSTMQMVAVRP